MTMEGAVDTTATEIHNGEESAIFPAVPRKSSRSVQFRGGLDKVTQKTKAATQATTKGLTKVTTSTTKGLNKARENTTRSVGTAIKQSEDVYEKSVLCWLPRSFVKNFPRLFSFCFGVVLPLWLLILISAGFGVILAGYEAPEEIASNNAILKSRTLMNRNFVNRTDLGQLPLQCYLMYLAQTNRSQLEGRIIENILESSVDTTNTTNATAVNMTDASSNVTGINTTNIINGVIDYGIDDLLIEVEEDLKKFMTKCQGERNSDTQIYLEIRDEHGDAAANSLTFNWIRCWPKDINDVWGETSAVFFPPEDLISASRPEEQEKVVEAEFFRIIDEEESSCLDAGGEEEECLEAAFLVASDNAGSNVCHENLEATSWFFFTVMTTVGYGNQAPVTDGGRLLIYIAGIASLILFAAVLGSSGYIITSIFNDGVSRLPYVASFLQYPLVGVIYWGLIWIGWAYAIAVYADKWWSERLPNFDVEVDDTLWFAFISTSTIGLGDYFLQPSVMFAGDALQFSVLFLVGFVFLSTFLNKIAEFLLTIVPQRQNSLETRLKETNLIFWKHWPCNDYLRSYARPSISQEITGKSSGQTSSEMKKQVERVESFKSHLPNQTIPPPLNTMNLMGEKNMVDLLDEEEMILKVLLESVEQRRMDCINGDGSESYPAVVRTIPLMAGMSPEVALSDQDDAMSA